MGLLKHLHFPECLCLLPLYHYMRLAGIVDESGTIRQHQCGKNLSLFHFLVVDYTVLCSVSRIPKNGRDVITTATHFLKIFNYVILKLMQQSQQQFNVENCLLFNEKRFSSKPKKVIRNYLFCLFCVLSSQVENETEFSILKFFLMPPETYGKFNKYIPHR